MRPFIAIDPGTTQSAIVFFRESPNPTAAWILENHEILGCLQSVDEPRDLVIEMIASYGMPVGASVFETCVWIGRFQQAFEGETTLMKRVEVKMHLCHTNRGVTDANIRTALIDLYGGSKERAVGLKKTPGPLYGIKKDLWAALAVGRTWYDKQLEQPTPSSRAIAPVDPAPAF